MSRSPSPPAPRAADAGSGADRTADRPLFAPAPTNRWFSSSTSTLLGAIKIPVESRSATGPVEVSERGIWGIDPGRSHHNEIRARFAPRLRTETPRSQARPRLLEPLGQSVGGGAGTSLRRKSSGSDRGRNKAQMAAAPGAGAVTVAQVTRQAGRTRISAIRDSHMAALRG